MGLTVSSAKAAKQEGLKDWGWLNLVCAAPRLAARQADLPSQDAFVTCALGWPVRVVAASVNGCSCQCE